MSSETENVNMNIENAETTNQVNELQSDVKLTGEMLSKVQVSVNMKFLAEIRNVLEVATQRSAWRANELTAVGSIVDTLDNAFKQLANKSDEVVAAAQESTDGAGAGAGASDGATESVNQEATN